MYLIMFITAFVVAFAYTSSKKKKEEEGTKHQREATSIQLQTLELNVLGEMSRTTDPEVKAALASKLASIQQQLADAKPRPVPPPAKTRFGFKVVGVLLILLFICLLFIRALFP